MAMGSVGSNTVVAFFMIAALLQSANAATHTVGGSTGWTLGISSTFYDDWANTQTFAVGDSLAFDYSGTTHNVFEVTATDLANCNLNSPLKTYETSGGASVPISTAGDHYYICGVPGHCLSNMQITITVPAAAPTTPPTVAPAPAKAAPAPAPVKAAPAPAPTKTAPAPAPSKAVPAPAPSKEAPAPSPKAPGSAPATTPATVPVVPVPSTSPVAAPGPAPGTSKGHLSAAPAMVVGVVLCVVTSLLFQ